jgi:predicted dehydrogenase
VLCEKPFTLDAAEAASLAERAAAAEVVGVLGHEFRWSPLQSAVEWALGEGLIGRPRLCVSISFISMLRAISMPDWWFDEARGGGWLGASGSHRIDALRQWFGEVEAVSATLPALREPALAVDDTFDLRCRMRSGVEASLIQSASAVGPGSSSTRILGTAGTLWADGPGARLAQEGEDPGGRLLDLPPGAVLPDVEHLATGALADMTRMELPPYIRLAGAFRDAIEGRPPAAGPRPATFADGWACMRALDAARASARQGGAWVRLPD